MNDRCHICGGSLDEELKKQLGDTCVLCDNALYHSWKDTGIIPYYLRESKQKDIVNKFYGS